MDEVSGDGLDGLIGEIVVIWCINYIYSGKLEGVNDAEIRLSDPLLVYETGVLTDSRFKDAEPLPGEWHIRKAAIESYGKAFNTL